jgi:fumarate reductase (CoM/CoB) subunit A
VSEMGRTIKVKKSIVTDVIVIGGGTAGAAAAIEARNFGVDVVLVDKGRLGFSGSSCTSDGETSAVFSTDDSPEQYLDEALHGGEGVSIRKLTETLIYESKQAVEKLSIYGVPYAKTSSGDLDSYRELGMSHPRTPKVLGGGPAFMLALRKEVMHREVMVSENVMVHELLLGQNNVPCGCLGIDIQTGEHIVFNAKAIVLAAGSATRLFPYSTANFLTTGDGYWLGYEAGADFINMEFPEFSIMPAPGGEPLHTGGIKPLTGRGAKFFNRLGERFMERYDAQRKELVKRSHLVRALYQEIKEGRGPVYMDLTHLTEDDFQRMENVQKLGIINKLKEAGVNYRKDRFEWLSPAVHTFLGGIRTNELGETRVPGLFAAGENAGGVYGADRVGTFLTACAVFGFRAGRSAARYALRNSLPSLQPVDLQKTLEEFRRFSQPRSGKAPERLEVELREIAGVHLTLERNEIGLGKAIQELTHIKDHAWAQMKIETTKDVVKGLEIRNMALTGVMVAQAAFARRESRGQHHRKDFPARDDGAWLKWIILKKEGGDISVTDEKIT